MSFTPDVCTFSTKFYCYRCHDHTHVPVSDKQKWSTSKSTSGTRDSDGNWETWTNSSWVVSFAPDEPSHAKPEGLW